MKTLLEKELKKKPQEAGDEASATNTKPSVDDSATSTSQTKIKDEEHFGKAGEVEAEGQKENEKQTVRPKVIQQTNPDGKDNLMTFSRQKLALLQCEYDPKSCSGCGRPSARSQQCVKCKIAKYCGKECQRKDWKAKHKRHCKEII